LTGTHGTSNNGITFPYIGFISYLLLAVGVVGVIILLVLLFLLNSLFRRAQRHRDFLEADKQATIQAQQIQEREAQQASMRAVPPRAHQPIQQAASYPAKQAANGILNVPSLVSLSPAIPVTPAQSSEFANYPTVDMHDIQHGKTVDMDKTQPFSPNVQHTVQGSEEHVGIEAITSTNPGIKRKYKPNEDSLFAVRGMRNENGQAQQIGLFVVADGMGGHANGQDASRLAIQTIIDYVLPRLVHGEDTQETAEKLLVDSVQLANQAVHQHNVENNADMGTTVTATLVIDGTAHVANVGDSRTYLYRASDGLTKVTRDHSVVASLVDAGIIKPDDIYTHPKRNQIYRSLGEKPFVEVDPFTVQLQPGDKLLLCSDGLWDMVRDPEIKHVLETPTSDPQQIGNNLITAALNGGGEDNVSVIVVNVMDHAPKQTTQGLETIYLQENVKMPPL
jgi:serine/threonine protein phosphatase PrpC